jgi:hypothetical protein
MPLRAPVNSGGKDFESVSAGTHLAVCRAVIDLGIQPGRGQYPQPRHEVYLGFEVPGERATWVKDGKDMEGPKAIGRSFTLSMSEKSNLRKNVQAWRGKTFSDKEAEEFDITKLAGQPCLLTVTHSEDGKYANIVSITGVPRGVPAPTLEGSLLVYTEDDKRQLDELPKWLREKVDGQLDAAPPPKVAASREAADDAMAAQYGGGSYHEDPVPFAPLHKRSLWA